MALVLNERVKETTTTTGTGALSLGGASDGFETFAAGIGNSNTTYYAIFHSTADEFEVGLGTLDGDSSDLTRTTIYASSNSDSAVNFSAGTKTVFCTMPAARSVFLDADGDVTLGANLDVSGNLTVTGTTTFNGGTLTLGDANTDNIVFGGEVDSDIIPDDDGTFDLGSSSKEWQDLFIDGTAKVDTLTVDENATVAGTLGVTGVLTGTSLDISGDVDIDGTTNLDVVDIDGAVDMASTLTVGSSITVTNGTSDFSRTHSTTNSSLQVLDLKATSSGNMADGFGPSIHFSAADGGATSNQVAEINVVRAGSDTAFNIELQTADTTRMTIGNGLVTVVGELDASSLDISGDADIDGTLEADAITVNGTALASVIAGTTVANATLAATVTVTDSTANTNFPVVFHDESNALLDDTGALRYNPSTGELLVPKLTVAGTTTTVDTVTMNAANAVIFEGATADAHETTLTIIDPTGDRTINLPNVSGTLPVLAAASTTQITSTPEELNLVDGITAGTVSASLAVIVDSNKDITGFRNVTLTGELDAATLDISGAVDIAGALVTHDDFTLTGASTGAVWDSSNNSLDFADSTQLRFGAGADLKIYHDGSNSYIVDSGTGNLKIAAADLQLMNAAGSELMIQGIQDGAVTLYHNNIAKLATTSTGVNVTGLVEFDSISGTGSVAITDIADEDDMSSDSATLLATQQSIKAYADTKATPGFAVAMAIAL